MSETGDFAVTVSTTGGEIKVTMDDVRRQICEKATDKEIVQFLNICKFRKLNPFLNEVYLIKFGDTKASIVVSKEAFMKRADSHPAYDGLRAGIVLKGANGELIERDGSLYTDGETLLGGWAEVYRKDRRMPFKAVVSLREYSRNQASWNTMKATMIRKVAEVHALREAFPSEVGGLYIEDEIQNREIRDVTPAYEVPESILAEIDELCQTLSYNDAKKNMLLGQYKGKEQELASHLKSLLPNPEPIIITEVAIIDNVVIEDNNNPQPMAEPKEELLPLKPDTKPSKGKKTESPIEKKRNDLIAKIHDCKSKLPENVFANIRGSYPQKVDNFSMQELVMLAGELEKALSEQEAKVA